jgi:hypothetical protein
MVFDDLSGSLLSTKAASSKHGVESSCSVNDGVFLDKLSDYQFLNGCTCYM